MFRYQLIIFLLTPAIVIYTLFRAVKFKDTRYLFQRLGIINKSHLKISNSVQEKSIWIHAASVGEVIAALPLIQEISKQHPNTAVIITTNTTTSAEIVEKQLASIPMVQHSYMPFDWMWAMNRTIKIIQPCCILIVETEIWPNLFSISHSKDIPIIIINARLSHRTTSAKPWLLKLYKNTLQNVSLILARSKEDHESYLILGAPKSKVKLVGNIKYASSQNSKLKSISIERPYVLAASTHDDEELQLTSVWMELIKNNIVSNEILVIVPRHPDRSSIIIQQLKTLNANISIRSKNDPISDSTQVYIADTIGELKALMLNAKFIFMGGSLVKHGGQNIIEPAQLKKSMIFGPYMYNFKDECKLLLDNNAAIQINNVDELINSFTQLLQNEQKNSQLAQSALQAIQSKGDSIVQNYLVEIEQYFKL